jgi:hypothetical protein
MLLPIKVRSVRAGIRASHTYSSFRPLGGGVGGGGNGGSPSWYCGVATLCGNGHMELCEGNDPHQEATALAEAYEEGDYMCHNRGGVVNRGTPNCDRR